MKSASRITSTFITLGLFIVTSLGLSPALRAQTGFKLLDSSYLSLGRPIDLRLDTAGFVVDFERINVGLPQNNYEHVWTRVAFDLQGAETDRTEWFTNTPSSGYLGCRPSYEPGSFCGRRTGTAGNTYRYLRRFGPAGNILWQRDFPDENMRFFPRRDGSVVVLTNKEYSAPPNLLPSELRFTLLSKDGDVLIEQTYPDTIHFYTPHSQHVFFSDDQNALYCLVEPAATDTFLAQRAIWKIDVGTGDIKWQKAVSYNFNNLIGVQRNRVVLTNLQHILVLDSLGTELFTDSLPRPFASWSQEVAAFEPVVTNQNSVLLPMYFLDWSVDDDVHMNVSKWLPDGSLFAHHVVLPRIRFSNWYSAFGVELPTGQLQWLANVLTGPLVNSTRLAWVTTDSNGMVIGSRVEGRVRQDANVNCAPDTAEAGLGQTLVQLWQDDVLWTDFSNDTGFYRFPLVDTGLVILRAIPPSYLWETCPDTLSAVMPDSFGTVLTLEPTLQPLADCPFLRVELGAAFLRRCFTNTIVAQYCNHGTAPATDVKLDLLLPPGLDFDTASQTITWLGDTLRYALGTLNPGQCGQVWLRATPNCDSVALGATLCVEAFIRPDTLCVPLSSWSGALLDADAACTGDSMTFTVRNIGNATSTPGLDFIVIEDHVITRQGLLPALAPNSTFTETVAATGQTVRWRNAQEPGAPASNPSVAVAGCAGASPGPFVLEFPNQSGSPFAVQLCRPVIGAYDPNDKQGFPLGYGPEHYIEPGTELDYVIRFQNTGTDTAFKVVIVDTLSPWLDPATLRLGPASHAYTAALTEGAALVFTFDQIMLPDSNANEPASHGFVQFTIKPRPDAPLETDLLNTAEIFFDFNAPIVTNTTVHRLGVEFVHTAIGEPAAAAVRLDAWPNPFAGETRLRAHGLDSDAPIRWRVFNSQGREVRRWTSAPDSDYTLATAAWPAGLYWLRAEQLGRWIGTTKLICTNRE